MNYIATFAPISDRKAAKLQRVVSQIDPTAAVMGGWNAGRNQARQVGYVAVEDGTPADTLAAIHGAVAEAGL